MFSRTFLICCLFLGVSCAGRTVDLNSQRAGALLHTRLLIKQYGEISRSDLRAYLSYLEDRLSSAAMHAKSGPHPNFTFVVLNSPEPLAFSPGGGIVLFSRGLLLNMANEAELAFVLAHELAHQTLGHTKVSKDRFDLESVLPYSLHSDEPRELELQADKQALGIVAFAGYDPHYALSALQHAYRSLPTDETESKTHPDLSTRIQALDDAIRASGWQPPGTINRWTFLRIRRELAL